jgi:hypothetical protein
MASLDAVEFRNSADFGLESSPQVGPVFSKLNRGSTPQEEDTMRLLLMLAVVAMAISLEDAMAKPSSTGFKVGEPFPNLVLPSLEDGKPLSLARFRRQKVILHIFASW